jgi:hypothetical protein
MIPEGEREQPMVQVTQDVVRVRSWVQSRSGWPCRRLDGGIAVAFPGDRCRGIEIGWGEFEPNFCARRYVLVHDDALGSTRCFLGTAEAARSFLAEAASAAPLPGVAAALSG